MEEINSYYLTETLYNEGKFDKINNLLFCNNYLKIQKKYVDQIQETRKDLYENDMAISFTEFNNKIDFEELSKKIISEYSKYSKYDKIYYIEKLNDKHLNTFNVYRVNFNYISHWSYFYSYNEVNFELVKSIKLEQTVFNYDGGFNLDKPIVPKKNIEKDNIKEKLLNELKTKLSLKKN
jgi:hypothetical protein